jgi:hypothetical protein
MKMLTVILLVGMLALVPVLAAAQTGGGSSGGTQAPSGSTPAEKPEKPGAGSSGGTQGKTPGMSGGDSPAASPSGKGDPSRMRTKAECEGAGGTWTESTKTCKK